MSDDLFGDLRSLLQAAPSPARWERLAALLESWPDPDDLAARVVPYVRSHLRDDPHPRPAPQRWLEELAEEPDGGHAALSLVDTISWSPGERVEGEAVVRALRGRGVLSNLGRFELAFVRCASETMGAVGAELSPSLEVLKLWCCGGAAASRLFEEAELPSLHKLDLGACDVSGRTIELLDGARRLERLRLAVSGVDAETIDALAASPWFGQLRALDMRHTEVHGAWFGSITDALPPTLEVLKLGGCPLSEADVLSLCEAPFTPTLRHLDLGRACHLDESQALDSYDPFRSSGYTHVSDFRAFFERSRSMSSLEHLELHQLGLDVTSVEALHAAEHLRSVRRLDVSINDLGDDGVEALLQTPLCGGLDALDLSFNGTTAALAGILVESSALRGLRELSLRSANLGPIGVRWLSQAPFMSQLEVLDLYWNGVDSHSSLQSVLGALDPSRVRSLDLSDNPLDDRAAQALIDAGLTALERLLLDRSALSSPSRAALRQRYPFVHFLD